MAILITYNINGIRAAIWRNFSIWFKEFNADIVCFQEIKANTSQFDTELFDTDNTFASNKFTPGESGKYLLGASLAWDGLGNAKTAYKRRRVEKTGGRK